MKTYDPQVGDEYTYESRSSGVRYKGKVVAVSVNPETGKARILGLPTSYWPETDLLIEVRRGSKSIYSW